jgi:hypothetical protein
VPTRVAANRNKEIMYKHQEEQGFTALISILVVSAIALAIAMSITLLGIGEAKSSDDYKKGQTVLKIAQACGEEALLRVRNDDTYSGGSLNVGDGSCTISVSTVGEDKTIDITANLDAVNNFQKSVQITAKRAERSINIVSWKEIN